MPRITLNEFTKTKNADLGENYHLVMAVIEKAAKTINDKLSRNGLIEEQGYNGEKNVYGEDVAKLDAYSNQVFTDMLLACPAVHGVGSEEMAEPKYSDHGVYNITHDPLDGSSNIDTNLPIGTIFGIYPVQDTLIAKGTSLVASGYIMYGPSLLLIVATPGNVNCFTYDMEANEFVLSRENIRIGIKKYFAVNEGNWELFTEEDRNYLTAVKKDGGYSGRYVGSMVGDIHRTLLKGGIFVYPSDSKHPDGKLRLLYEVAPLGNVIIQAGGLAVSRGVNALELLPTKHDQRVPIVLGTKEEVEKYLSFQKQG